MGAIGFGLLLIFVVKAVWDFATNDFERTKMVHEYKEKPIAHIVILIWLLSIFLFVAGILVPDFGRLEIAQTGWHVVEVGALGFFGIFAVNLFYDFDKLDGK